MLLNRLVLFVTSFRLGPFAIPMLSTTPINAGPPSPQLEPARSSALNVAGDVLGSTAAVLVQSYIYHRLTMYFLTPATTSQKADDGLPPLPRFSWLHATCGLNAYDGPDEALRPALGVCDVPISFFQSTLVAKQPRTFDWPVCSVSSYDGPEEGLLSATGVCDWDLPIFHPTQSSAPVLTSWQEGTLSSFRWLASVYLESDKVLRNLSDHLKYLGRLLPVSLQSLGADLDWPILHTLPDITVLTHRLVSFADGASVSQAILSRFYMAQAFGRLGDILRHLDFGLISQVLCDEARHTSRLLVSLGCGLPDFLQHTIHQITTANIIGQLSSELIEILPPKVDLKAIFPLPEDFRLLGQLYLFVALMAIYIGYRRVRSKRHHTNATIGGPEENAKLPVRFTCPFLELVSVPTIPVDEAPNLGDAPPVNEDVASFTDAPSPASPPLAMQEVPLESAGRIIYGLKKQMPSRKVGGRRLNHIKRKR